VNNLDLVRQAWSPAPDWIEAMARACDASSQAEIARRVGISRSAVNLVLKNRYRARCDAIEKRVRGALMGALVECPVLMTSIPLNDCMTHQARPYSSANFTLVQLFRTCPTCPNRLMKPEEKQDA